MNREILFRGKHDRQYTNRDEWVYGVPYFDHDDDCIITTDNYKLVVIAKTVGQFTGLTYRNGVKIFEGDIVTVDNPNISDDEYDIVKFDNDGAMFIAEFDTFTVDFGNNIDGNQCEIIGNIFDNHELLGGD